MAKIKDLSGQRFGKLVAVELSHTNGRAAYWICLCDCGRYKTIRSGDLTMGRTLSCGCWRRFVSKTKATTHGLTKTRLHMIWTDMKSRCNNRNDKFYHRYGGRGICVSEEWLHDFLSFYNWSMQNGYDKGLTIERIDNNKDYSPENCRWATWTEQANNTSRNRMITFNGETLTMMQWHRKTGINYSTMRSKIARGVDPSDIFS